MSNEVTCGECGELIEGEPPIPDDPAQRKPCPRCGSKARKQGISARLQAASFATGTITAIPYAEILLAKSQELISRGDFNIATVVAHMACEIAAERAISLAFAIRGLGYLEDAVTSFVFGYNLSTERIRNLYNALALSGRRIQDQRFWEAFMASANRRNAVVHKAGSVTKEQAEETQRAATELVAYLKG
jgi:hypothetical protein